MLSIFYDEYFSSCCTLQEIMPGSSCAKNPEHHIDEQPVIPDLSAQLPFLREGEAPIYSIYDLKYHIAVAPNS